MSDTPRTSALPETPYCENCGCRGEFAALNLARELEREIERLRERVSVYAALAAAQHDRAERAERELAEVRQDAERYRWLRDTKMTYEQAGPHYGWCISEVIPGDDPDAAIDAARKP